MTPLEELSARKTEALAELRAKQADVARRRRKQAASAGNLARVQGRAEELSRERERASRNLETIERLVTEERVEAVAEGKDFAVAVPDFVADHRRDLAEAESAERAVRAVLGRLREDLATAEAELREAESAVRAAAVSVLHAEVDDRLDILQRARAEVERCELFVEGVLKLTSGPLHADMNKFVGVPDRLRGHISWRSKTFNPATDPLALSARERQREFEQLLAGDGED